MTPCSTIDEIKQILSQAEGLRVSDPNTAEHLVRTAIDGAQSLGVPALEAEGLELLCRISPTGARYDLRLGDMGKALLLFRQLGNVAGQVRILSRMGNVANNVSDYLAALEFLYEAEDLSNGIGDAALLREVSGQIGGTLEEVGDHRTALEYSRRTLSVTDETAHPVEWLFALNGLGCSQSALGEHDEALANLRLCHQRFSIITDERRRNHVLAQSCSDLAQACLRAGKPADARGFALDGIEFAKAIAMPSLKAFLSSPAGLTSRLLRP